MKSVFQLIKMRIIEDFKMKFDPHDFELLKIIIGKTLYDDMDYYDSYNIESKLGLNGYNRGFISYYEYLCYIDTIQNRVLTFTNLSNYYEKCLKLEVEGNNINKRL